MGALEQSIKDFEEAARLRDEELSHGCLLYDHSPGHLEEGTSEAAVQRREQDLVDSREQAWLDLHESLADDYARDAARLNSDIRSLQRTMVDLSTHTQAQGDLVDNIEANMIQAVDASEGATTQLVRADAEQRRRTRLLHFMLLLAVLLAAAVIIASVRKSGQHQPD